MSTHITYPLTRSYSVDDFKPIHERMSLEESHLRLAIINDATVNRRLDLFGFNVFDHLKEDTDDFLVGVYRTLLNINNRLHICHDNDVINGMGDLRWIREFLKSSATEIRVYAVASRTIV